jgi:hypothetical protein
MRALGLDIGGANLKAAIAGGGKSLSRAKAWSMPFELWRQPDALADRLGELIAAAGRFDQIALTMTAELCDCFETKRQGVLHVLAAVEAIAGARPVRVWTTAGRFVTPADLYDDPLPAAAANWHALATFAASLFPEGASLLIDMGSTTTDVVRLCDGRVDAIGLTDTERLTTRELVYVGALRTPLMALGPTVEWQGRAFGVMAESFATMADVAVLTGWAPQRPDCTDTADGRPMTMACAAVRVARMIGGDGESMAFHEALQLAAAFQGAAVARVADAVRHVTARRPVARVIVSGGGAMLAIAAAGEAFGSVEMVSLADLMGHKASAAACAVAVARLGQRSPTPVATARNQGLKARKSTAQGKASAAKRRPGSSRRKGSKP